MKTTNKLIFELKYLECTIRFSKMRQSSDDITRQREGDSVMPSVDLRGMPVRWRFRILCSAYDSVARAFHGSSERCGA